MEVILQVYFSNSLRIDDILSTSSEIIFSGMPVDNTDEKSTLVQVMAWQQAFS